jgi:hypothetical protein
MFSEGQIMRRMTFLAAVASLAIGSTALAAVSGGGHGYSLECNENGFVLRSDYPVYRWAKRGFRDLRELDHETLFLGKDCDAYHQDLGWRGRWWWANGGIVVEYENAEISFPRADIGVWAGQCPRELDLTDCRL